MPTNSNSPRPISPIVSPSTSTRALRTRCTNTRMSSNPVVSCADPSLGDAANSINVLDAFHFVHNSVQVIEVMDVDGHQNGRHLVFIRAAGNGRNVGLCLGDSLQHFEI